MTPEYRATETKTETETKSCHETETRNYETETSLVNVIARESKTNRQALLSIKYLKLKLRLRRFLY